MRRLAITAAAVLVVGLLIRFTASAEAGTVQGRRVLTADQLALDEEPSDQAGWVRVECEEGGFSVMMPGEPAYESRVSEHAVGSVEETGYRFKGAGSDFVAQFSELPPMVAVFGRRIVYRLAARHLLRGCGCVETERSRMRIGLHRGVEIRFESPSSEESPARVGRAVFLLVDRRLYVLSALVEMHDDAEGLMEDFFESFELRYRMPERVGHKYLEMRSDWWTPEDRLETEDAEDGPDGPAPR